MVAGPEAGRGWHAYYAMRMIRMGIGKGIRNHRAMRQCRLKAVGFLDAAGVEASQADSRLGQRVRVGHAGNVHSGWALSIDHFLF